MQDRRLIYIEQSDIPTSAVEWNGETTASPSGNVLYIPNANLANASLSNRKYVGIFGSSSSSQLVGVGNTGYYNGTAKWGGTTNAYGQTDYFGSTGIMTLWQHYRPILEWIDDNNGGGSYYALFPGIGDGGGSLYGYAGDTNSIYYGLYIKVIFTNNVEIRLFDVDRSGSETAIVELNTPFTVYNGYPIYIDTEDVSQYYNH